MTIKQFRVYIWIVTLLIEHPGITMEEIQKRWLEERQLSEGKVLHRRSFIRYCHEIKQLLGIEIACNRYTDYSYFIRNEQILSGDNIRNWMLTTLSVGLQVMDCMELSDRIILEHIPSGEKWLLKIIGSMKENKRIEITYRRYGNEEGWKAVVSPYCLKVYNKRWYLLGKIDKEKLYTLPLDRMLEVEVTDEVFEMDSNFDAQDYFKDMYGIFRNEKSRKRKVVLRAFGDESCYLRDLPLHHSQKEVGKGEGFVDFELNSHITKELSGYILSRGKRLKVVSPKSYANELAEMIGG